MLTPNLFHYFPDNNNENRHEILMNMNLSENY